jgi:glycosyltransferase involved in cell wall biosynthesis
MFRFHVLSPPHTVANKNYLACAFTQKVVNFCKMMKSRGHYIICYGHNKSIVECDEFVAITNDDVLDATYGDYDWKNIPFKFDVSDYAHTHFHNTAITEISKRKQQNDFLLCFWGHGHKPVADAHSDMIVVEPSIGYASQPYPNCIFTKYRAFDSHSMKASWYGITAVNETGHTRWTDAVIPPYFDMDDFKYNEEKEDYFLFVGRIGQHKGTDVAIQTARAVGAKLKIAGQGNIAEMGYTDIPEHVEIVGYADVETRKRLMSNAKALFVPSTYNEPFGMVAIEAMLSGTPVISSDNGSFGEINLHGITGYRCSTFEQFTWAAFNIETINPRNCREWGENFSLDKVGLMYEEFFTNILNSTTDFGWFTSNPSRTNLDWLNRKYPQHPNRQIVRIKNNG